MTQKPNILLISIDTLRADHLSCYGYARHTSPNIDRIALEGAIFRQAYSTAAWTPPAHASMLTGLLPSQHGVIDQNKLGQDVPTLAELLQKNGYRTAGFVNNSQVGALVGLDKGHEDFIEVWLGAEDKNIFHRGAGFLARKFFEIVGRDDDGAHKTNQSVLKWFEERGSRSQPFYVFLHYIDVHNPYKAPHPFRFRFLNDKVKRTVDLEKIWLIAQNPLVCLTDEIELTDDELNVLKALYDGEISYLDHKIGELLGEMRKRGLLEKTFLIITADHGEHFGEHGLFSHVASVYEPVIHIPLIIRYPEMIDAGQEIEQIVQLIDIFPTVLNVAQIQTEANGILQGKDLLPLQKNCNYHDYLIAEWEGRIPFFVKDRIPTNGKMNLLEVFTNKLTAIRSGNEKLIVESNGKSYLYDLSMDPFENIDIAETKPAVADSLRHKLEEWRNSVQNLGAAEPYEIPDQMRRHLKALGYL